MKRFLSGPVPRFTITFFCLWLASLKLIAQENAKKVIRNIEIERHVVFTDLSRKPRFIYNWANHLHIVTKESVIRQELLFKSGDEYDPEILEESERKLRSLSYFGEVTVAVTTEEETFVDVLVTTQDQWSTIVAYVFERGGGRTTFGGGIEEFNFLGLGKRIFTEITHEVSEGTQINLRYTDPQLFSSRWTAQGNFVTGPFLKNYSARIIRPFYALDTKWAYGFTGFVRDQTRRFFANSLEVDRFRDEKEEFQVFGARAFGGRFHKKRVQLNYRFSNKDITSLPDTTIVPLPDDEVSHALILTATFENLSFVEETQIDKFVRVEDLTLGNVTQISLGRTGIPFPNGVKRFELRVVRREAHQIFDRQYLFLTLGVQTLFEKNTIASLRLRYYHKFARRQTLAFNFEFDYADKLEDSQLLLGGDSGLRGYPARAFAGDKRLLLNVEDRIFSSLNILTVQLGGVLFFDAGNVWNEEASINLNDLNYSAGFGLRLGYVKSPDSRVGRIDFGWALNGGGGFGVVIGVDQIFSVN